MGLLNATNALYEARRKLHKFHGMLFLYSKWVDKNRKCILRSKEGHAYFALFKRAPFRSYGKIFGGGGFGESINVEDFENCVYVWEIYEFLYIYPDGSIYKIDSHQIKKKGFQWVNKADGRIQYIFPMKALQRLC